MSGLRSPQIDQKRRVVGGTVVNAQAGFAVVRLSSLMMLHDCVLPPARHPAK
jgi:hypothetical protein